MSRVMLFSYGIKGRIDFIVSSAESADDSAHSTQRSGDICLHPISHRLFVLGAKK